MRQLLCAVAFVATTAHAADLPGVAVLPFVTEPGLPPALGAQFEALISDELLTRDAVLRKVDAPRAPAAGPSQRAAALKLIATGRKQAASGQFGAAANSLRKGTSLALSDPAHAPLDDVIDGLLTLAVAELRTGDEKSSRAALSEIVRLAPSLRLKRGRYPPVFIREFDRTRARILRGGSGALTVDAPAGATVYVDGRKAGTGTVRVKGLPHGTHFVQIEADGQRAGVQTQVEGRETKVALSFAVAAAAPELSRTLTAEQLSALDAYAKSVRADFLLVGALGDAGVKVRAGAALFSVAAGGLVPLPDVEFGADLSGGAVAALNLGDAITARLGAPATLSALPLDLLEAAPPVASPVLPAASNPVAVVRPPTTVAAEPVGKPRGLLAAVPWWVWAGGAALVVGGVTTAGVLHAHRPVTATVEATW